MVKKNIRMSKEMPLVSFLRAHGTEVQTQEDALQKENNKKHGVFSKQPTRQAERLGNK